MHTMMTRLLDTKALDIAPPDRPYWYASGTFGPFFINTHYLLGGETCAKGFLAAIEDALKAPETLTERLLPTLRAQKSAEGNAYHDVMEEALQALEPVKDAIDFVSGGERRDLFFSLAVADALGKPHLTILKDGRCYYRGDEGPDKRLDPRDLPLESLRGLHVADLVTEASSFFRNWIPAVEALGASMAYAFAVVDRGQGGAERLAEAGIPLLSLVVTGEPFFRLAFESGAVSREQADQCIHFLEDPAAYREEFLGNHRGFLERELAAGGRTGERAALFIANRARNHPIAIPEAVRKMMRLLEDAGFDCFVVGGYLRDSLLGRRSFDMDLATSATPEEVIRSLPGFTIIPTGVRHGTLTVMTGVSFVEVTTFRSEGAYSDCRHPDDVHFTETIEEDLARRDFTINALAWNEKRGLVDLWGGQSDLSRGIIRTVGDPDRRFSEDALRLFRAMRLSSELGFRIDTETEDAMFRNRDLLRLVAPERLQVEFNRMAAGLNAFSVLRSYAEIIAVIIPEMTALARAPLGASAGGNETPASRLDASILSISHLRPEAALRLAALLYDLGEVLPEPADSEEKSDAPRGRDLAEGTPGSTGLPSDKSAGKGVFERSAALAEGVLRALRYDRATISRVQSLLRFQGEDLVPEKRSVWRALHAYGDDIFFKGLELRRARELAVRRLTYGGIMPHAGTAGADVNQETPALSETERVARLARDIIQGGQRLELKDLAIDGQVLADRGFKGQEIGLKLEELLEKVCVEGFPNTAEALLSLL